MADVTFDAGEASGANYYDVSSVTFSHTCGAGATMLVVEVSWAPSSGTRTVTGVTYNGVAMTPAGAPAANGTRGAQLFWLKNPAAGAHNVVVTMSSVTSNVYAGATSFVGADTVSGYATNTGTSAAPSVTVASKAGAMVVDVIAAQSDPTTAKTLRWQDNRGSYAKAECATAAGAASVAMSYTMTSGIWAIAGLSIDPPASAGGDPSAMMDIGIG